MQKVFPFHSSRHPIFFSIIISSIRGQFLMLKIILSVIFVHLADLKVQLAVTKFKNKFLFGQKK